jgi:DNA-binding CsgD family transcriptional regulator
MNTPRQPAAVDPLTPTGLNAPLTTYVAAADGFTAGRVRHALEREGLDLSFEWGPLAALGAGPGVRRLHLVVVVEREGAPLGDGEFADLRAALPLARLVVVCSPERERPQSLLWAGVDGFVVEPGASAALGPVVRAVLAGYVVLPRGLRAAIVPPPLSPSEREMLGLLVEGLTNREIAHRLYLAESTVKRRLSATFRRLGVGSRREAAAAVMSAEPGFGPGVLPSADRDE